MKVFVTGGAGYVGSFATRRLLGAGHDVMVADNLSTGRPSAVPDKILRVVDIRDEAAMDQLFRDFRPDAVMHFAALKSAADSLQQLDLYIDVNVQATANLLKLCARHGVSRFVFSSSCSVYGTAPDFPVGETTPCAPVSPYGETKAICERLIRWYGRTTGMRYANLRYFNAAGAAPDGSLGEYASARNRQLLPMAIRAAVGLAAEVQVFGGDYPTRDGTAVRDYVHVEDLAEAHLRALEGLGAEDACGAYNLGQGQGTSVLEVLAALRSASGRSPRVVVHPRRPGDPTEVWADNARIREKFGWMPRFGTEEIVRTAWEWHARDHSTLR